MVSVGTVDESAEVFGGVVVAPMTSAGVHPGEDFHVVADACCDSGERFAGVELGARIPVALSPANSVRFRPIPWLRSCLA